MFWLSRELGGRQKEREELQILQGEKWIEIGRLWEKLAEPDRACGEAGLPILRLRLSSPSPTQTSSGEPLHGYAGLG